MVRPSRRVRCRCRFFLARRRRVCIASLRSGQTRGRKRWLVRRAPGTLESRKTGLFTDEDDVPTRAMSAILTLWLTGTTGWAQTFTEGERAASLGDVTSAVEMAACTSGLEASERALVDALRDLGELIPPTRLPLPENAQLAWTDYRDASCEWIGAGHSGGMQNSLIVYCKADMNRARVLELSDYST